MTMGERNGTGWDTYWGGVMMSLPNKYCIVHWTPQQSYRGRRRWKSIWEREWNVDGGLFTLSTFLYFPGYLAINFVAPQPWVRINFWLIWSSNNMKFNSVKQSVWQELGYIMSAFFQQDTFVLIGMGKRSSGLLVPTQHNKANRHRPICPLCPSNNKEITLSLWRPRDAPNMWVPWKL